ncbi:hypothetical protein EVAR_56836_1 [Eumeta japonica]|uniref:Uncharacterized protein n=1 Tax=Eumeta variegata TaxID=151549 RepID=A0A4C1ZBY0_EUMVA|nr:hypothetical protein EVAR_56836_1 [Eumeta japonica]
MIAAMDRPQPAGHSAEEWRSSLDNEIERTWKWIRQQWGDHNLGYLGYWVGRWKRKSIHENFITEQDIPVVAAFHRIVLTFVLAMIGFRGQIMELEGWH